MWYLVALLAGLIAIGGWLFVELKLGLAYRFVYVVIVFLSGLLVCSGLWYQEIIEERFRIQKNEIAFLDVMIDSAEAASLESFLVRLKRVRNGSRVSYEIRNNLTESAWKRSGADLKETESEPLR